MSEDGSPLLDQLAQQLEVLRERGVDGGESFMRFEGLVAEIAALDDPVAVPTLLRFLDDNLDLDLAFGIIHSVERFECRTYVPLLLEALPALREASSEWAETCLLRVLNSPSCLEVLLELARSLAPDQVSSLRATLAALVQRRSEFADRASRIDQRLAP